MRGRTPFTSQAQRCWTESLTENDFHVAVSPASSASFAICNGSLQNVFLFPGLPGGPVRSREMRFVAPLGLVGTWWDLVGFVRKLLGVSKAPVGNWWDVM